ncbi:MAG: nicotinamide-nucleotide adenylyltransferase [Candidatus Gracilibacteria bacterium]|jgi:nicotinamide-nucleotide adenylyltransferase
MQSALFVGRFQPFHNGHLDAVKKILKDNDRVIIAIGSAEKNYLPQNPFTASERFQMIEEALIEAKIPAEKYCIIPVININNFALWVNHLNLFVPPYTKLYTGSDLVKACYEGKYQRPGDVSKAGPKIIKLKRVIKVSATKVRQTIMQNKRWELLVPPAVAKKIKELDAVKRIREIKGTIDITKFNVGF